MEFQKKNIKNMCSFYASEWHLTVMLLPYISKQIENNVKFNTILKTEIVGNVQELISKLSLNKEIEEKMLNINWKINEINKVSIILNGTNKQVENIHKMIRKWLNKNLEIIQQKDIEITIISCFKALEIKNNIENIINEYDYALNTSGEHRIEEIYNIFKKVIS